MTLENNEENTARYYRVKQGIQLRLLNELSVKLQSLLESPQFFQEVLEIIQARFHYYSIQFWVVRPDGSIVLEAQSGAYVGHLPIGTAIPRGETSITGTVLRTQKSYLTGDVSRDPNFTSLRVKVQSKSQICVPIVRMGEVFGTLNIESDQANAFDDDDRMTLESVASQVAVALINRKLFDQVKEFNQVLQKTVEAKTLELRQAHDQIVEQKKLLSQENLVLRTLVEKKESVSGPEMIGSSPAFLQVVAMADKVAPTRASILIQGESGTGKELVARRIHSQSDRKEKPYVTLNCGALQEALLESELFGHEKGSFTGAVTQKIGLIETAHLGTLFLDEIGEISLAIQAKLLRVLQEGEFYRVGGKKPIHVDVRILSATNRDLETEVKAGRFREDLYYRLNTIMVRVPPLRKRKEDIVKLVEHFLKQGQGKSGKVKRIDPKVWDALTQYDWPGNIRELQNTVERLRILSDGQEITLDDLPFSIRLPQKKAIATDTSQESVEWPLEDIEKRHILQVLSYHQGNKTRAAQSLGITIKTLYNKLHRYGVAIGNDDRE